MASAVQANTTTTSGTTRDSLIDLLPGFSYPQADTSASMDVAVPMIVREYSAGLVGAYLGQQFAEIEAVSEGLAEYLGAWIADPAALSPGGPDPVPGWDYAFGDTYRSLVNGGYDSPRIVASVAAHLGACGQAGSWSVRLDRPLQLRWSDVLLPPATALQVSGEADRVDIAYEGPDGSGTETLQRSDDGWTGDHLPARARVSRHGTSFEVLTRDALAMRDYEDLIERALTSVPPKMYQVFDDALDIIKEYTPQYLPWTARTIHQMFLLSPNPGRVESGSVEHYLGLVHLSLHGEPLPVAELLVHEATHQYMNVIAKLEPLDDGSDPKRYWSPAVNTERPVSKIIAALHAFGNVILFYRSCRENGLANAAECERQEELLGGWMKHLAPPVVDNPALSATGNALCKPLLEQLHVT